MKIDDYARSVMSEPKIVRFTTIGPDGFPHTVPIWYLLVGEEFLMFTSRTSRKARNASLNPATSIAIGGDPVGSPSYLVQGKAEVVPDESHIVTKRITYHYETPEKAAEYLAAWREDDHVVIRITPTRIIKLD